MYRTKHRNVIKHLAIAATLAALASSAIADHAWGNYHWARTGNPFTIKLGDNVNLTWDGVLITASSYWSVSSVLNTTIVAGASNPKNCRPTAGRAEICNSKYGSNGWLGIAQIWASGSHISQGVVKLNDTYFNMRTYDTTAWRNLVTCQEVGHIFGLGHQDENFDNTNLSTCMDYTNSPDANQHPNAHDYAMLEQIYADTDSTTTIDSSASHLPAAMLGRDFDRQSSWGQMVKRSRDGVRETFVRDFGNGHHLITHVFWALEEDGPAHRQQRANED